MIALPGLATEKSVLIGIGRVELMKSQATIDSATAAVNCVQKQGPQASSRTFSPRISLQKCSMTGYSWVTVSGLSYSIDVS